MESTTKIAKKFFDDYSWTENPKPDFDTHSYSAITGIRWRHKTCVDVEDPILLRASNLDCIKELAFDAFKYSLFPVGSVAVVSQEDLCFLLMKCKEIAFNTNDARKVLKVVEEFVNKAPVI